MENDVCIVVPMCIEDCVCCLQKKVDNAWVVARCMSHIPYEVLHSVSLEKER